MVTRTKIILGPNGSEIVELTVEENAQRDAEEQAWADGQTDRDWATLRDERDRLIVETDWWAGSDLTMTDAQTTYRQELRDLPANTEDPANPTWPTKPE
jgi:hypothetical protein